MIENLNMEPSKKTAESQLAASAAALAAVRQPRLGEIGQIANRHAANAVFSDYLNRKAANTLKAHLADLTTFYEFLGEIAAGAAQHLSPEALQTDPYAWQEVTWGMVDAFVRWMLRQGYAIASVNRKLSTVKCYAKLATKANVLDVAEHALLHNVNGYSQKEGKRIDERRPKQRVSVKKAKYVRLDALQAQALKVQPDSPQGRRDRLLMCLLLDHGLRVGEVVQLTVEDVDLARGTFAFYRPKVNKRQVHRMTPDTYIAMRSWFDFGDAPASGALLRASRKDGSLWHKGLTERAVTGRVELLGDQVGVHGLSAHDCRHYWATRAVEQGTDAFALQDAGGWNSIAMPSRYVAAADIANERVKI
jgi:integrase